MSSAPEPGQTVVPGVLLAIAGLGVMLRGPSGAGKSDCALTLIERGHALVADDAVQLHKKGAKLLGCCPEAGYGLLHLRDLGILDIGSLFGPDAVKHNSFIGLVITLSKPPGETYPDALIHGRYGVTELCCVSIPTLTITAVDQRPLASLIEAAVAQMLASGRHPQPAQPGEPQSTVKEPVCRQSG